MDHSDADSADTADGGDSPGQPETHASPAGEAVRRANMRRAARRSSNRFWRRLLALDAALHRRRNLRLLTPEARVLLNLHLSGPVPVSSVMRVAGMSYRGFYAVLARLKLAGLVATVKDAKDQRVRRLSVNTTRPRQ